MKYNNFLSRRNLDDLNNSPDNPKKLKDDLDKLRKEK